MTIIDTSVLSTIEDNVKYTMLQLMHEILKSYNQSLDIIGDLNENQQELDGRVTENANNITKINGTLELVRDSIERLDGQMNATWPSELNRKINANTDSINSLGDDVSTHTQQLAGTAQSGLLTKINANTDSINSLEDNVSTHTQQLAGTAQSGLLIKVNTLQNGLQLLRDDINETNVNVSANTAAITKINTKDLPEIRGSISGITQNTSEMQEQLNNVTEKADNLENDIINLESDYGSLLSNQNYISTIIRCTNSNVIQRGSNNYWSIPLPTPAKTTAEGYVFVCIATEVLSSGTDPLYIAFDDGSGVYTTFARIVRFGGGSLTRSTFGVIAGNLVVLMLYDNSGTLEARVISQVLTA